MTQFTCLITNNIKEKRKRKSPAKRSQHANATYRNIVGRNMLRVFGHPVAMCCDMLGVEPTTPNMSQQGGQNAPNMLRSFGQGLTARILIVVMSDYVRPC